MVALADCVVIYCSSICNKYHSGVVSMLDYCSSVWGFCNLDKIDTVQNRALRLFLEVHKFAPNVSINADIGWISII